MAKARQQYFADETSLQKDSREFAIADDVQQKIDSIEEGAQVNVIETVKVNGTALTPDANKAVDIDVPDVIDNLYTTSSDDALSANQGKLLYDYIQNLSSRGRFLSNWNTATGLPATNPSENPYTYMAGDYYMVSNVASGGGTNYRPNGSSYTIGQASTTVETNIVDVSDIYLYDGTNWLLLTNSSRQIAVDSSLSTTSTNPVENRVITNELNKKYYGVVSNATPSNPTEGMLWYDTANDILKTYDGANWNEAGTQMVVLSYGNSTWNDFITAYADNAVVYCRASSNSNPATGTQTRMAFMAYVNNATSPTEVEFQYYRSRSDHNSAANQLDQVFVYKLTSASGGTWTVTERNTAAKAVAGTGINLAFGSGNMTISNTGVTSVNGDTGAVTVNDVKVSATAPSSPTEGMVWYDTTNDQLKVYDGTNWNVTGKEYNAGEGIEIGTIQDYSAMQGPAPYGFHVPLNTEWQAVKDIWTALGGGSSDGTNFGIALKLPFAGYRYYSSADVTNQGISGYYWSSSRGSTNSAYDLSFGSTVLIPLNADYRVFGSSVRCFKDTPTIPTSSWTKLYGTSIESGGIFWSSTDGLISLSSDGTNWITIADKNLGATTVWNSGDTLSEANCGKYYQRGNNYGFPFTGSVTTSSTQVDASTYGPGNYYSSSTFITRSSSPYRWDTTDNGNLRGGVTGVVTINDAITNTGVLSVNGQTGDVTVETPNTKTFYLENHLDITNAQAAYDWRKSGKNPLIVYKANSGNRTYSIDSYDSGKIIFWSRPMIATENNSISDLKYYYIYINYSGDTVTSITESAMRYGRFLSTDVNYSTPYTPTYNGSPTTKKYVDDRDTYIGSSAPTSNLVEGRLWYDTTNDQLKVYDGTNWQATGKEYNAGPGISIGQYQDYSAMRGPCPDGFHLATETEITYIRDTLITTFGLTSAKATTETYLKMPTAGYILPTDGSKRTGEGHYCSSKSGKSLSIGNSYVNISSSYTAGYGYSVRGFKDNPVIPDNTWTTLYDGSSVAAGAGVFYNSVLGLISVSGDGLTWVTIADKNLGATVVYNSGDTLSEANCGGFFQWGNNYMFPFTGPTDTSTTVVDVSGYGPGNYYSSSTFIKNSIPYTNYGNLRGGTTGVVTLDNAISNTGVLSVNGQTGDVTIDMSNYLAKDNTTAFTPSGNYNPATKKYVDDSIGGLSQIKVHLVSLPFSIGDDWSAIWDDLDGGGYSVVLADGSNRTGLVTFWTTSPSNIVTVVAGEDVYKVTLDSSYEISAIKILGEMRRFDSAVSAWGASDDITDIMEYLIAGGTVCVYDSAEEKMFYVVEFYVNGSSAEITFADNSYNWKYQPTKTGNVWYAGNGTYSANGFYLSSSTASGKTLVCTGGANTTWRRPGAYSNSTSPTSPSTGTLWWDSTNGELNVYNGSSWEGVGGGITKIFSLSGTGSGATVLAEAQAAYDWYDASKEPIVDYNGRRYHLTRMDSTYLYFTADYVYSANYRYAKSLKFTVSSGSVTNVELFEKTINITTSVPSTGDANTIYFVK